MQELKVNLEVNATLRAAQIAALKRLVAAMCEHGMNEFDTGVHPIKIDELNGIVTVALVLNEGGVIVPANDECFNLSIRELTDGNNTYQMVHVEQVEGRKLTDRSFSYFVSAIPAVVFATIYA